MKVVIAGAGIGGLALAQALVAAGDEVTIVERDQGIEDTAGYRLHLSGSACAVLRRHVAPETWEMLLAGSARAAAVSRLVVHDHRLRLLGTPRIDPAEELLFVDRRVLRRALLREVAGCVLWAQPVVGFDQGPEDVQVHTAKGTHHADLLVGADGPRSVVSTRLAGRAPARDLGIAGLAGRVPLTAAGSLSDLVTEAGLLAIGPDGLGLFLTCTTVPNRAAVDPAHHAMPVDPELIWSVIGPAGRIGSSIVGLDEVLRGWDSRVRSLPGLSDRASISRFPFLAADPRRELMPWPAGRVTALGDAVHAMPPTGGQGAATAIRDAGVLAEVLQSARSGASTLPVALADYQRRMTAYAPAAVAESLEPLRWMRLLGRPGLKPAASAVLSALAAGASLSRQTRALWRGAVA
ncbi:FAD-dependent monooxygenase [Kribbella sp. NBC_01505]|uniref:FAD-dependent oxidoreductase n=1 Tax=Kribbella sp. NBC_01505 TaxID=2903580 RepID=UPI00386A0E37